VYAGEAEWINDPFFKASLEPGTYEMITSEKYKSNTKNSPAYARNENGFKTAMLNLKKIFDAGITVALGTDSGAFPIRTQDSLSTWSCSFLTKQDLHLHRLLGSPLKMRLMH
jgi:hypothetical protein